jgi:hypothetical protein
MLLGPPRRASNATGIFDAVSNQEFETTFDYCNPSTTARRSESIKQPTVFRIDKDEMMTGMGLVRGNLVAMLSNKDEVQRLRQLVVDLEPQGSTAGNQKRQVWKVGLNVDQNKAVPKVMSGERRW